MEIRKKPSSTVNITAEYRLLNSLIKRPEFRDDARITEDLLTDETAKSLLEAIRKLNDRNIEITPASLYQAGTEIDYNVTRQIVDAIFDIDENGASNLNDIIPVLETSKKKRLIASQIELAKQSLQTPGNIDTESLRSFIYEAENLLNKEEIDSPIIDINQWIDLYLEELDQRKLGIKYSYGDVFLDEFLYKGAAPKHITTLAGSTGSGKSFFTLNIINNLIERNAPCIYLSLEMGDIDTFDRLVSLRCGIESADLYNSEYVDSIKEAVERERDILSQNTNFYFCQDPDIDMTKLRSIIREFKQRTKNDYAFVAIDLLTMMREFSTTTGSTAQSIEVAMNKLSTIAKTENVHIFGVVQFGRNADSNKIHSIEELGNLRPSLNDIKNSNAIAERSRVVLGLFHPKQYVDKYLVPLNAPGCENFEDTLELQILKNSHGGVGKIFKYMLISEQFKILPIEDENEAKMEILANSF